MWFLHSSLIRIIFDLVLKQFKLKSHIYYFLSENHFSREITAALLIV